VARGRDNQIGVQSAGESDAIGTAQGLSSLLLSDLQGEKKEPEYPVYIFILYLAAPTEDNIINSMSSVAL
jgi:hypothetical protein